MIQVLHGINQYGSKSVVRIDSNLSLEPFHAVSKASHVLLSNPRDEDGNVLFETSLPHLWEYYQVTALLKSLISGDTEQEDFVLQLQLLAKKTVGSMSTLPIMEYSAKHNLPIYPFIGGDLANINKRYYRVGIGKKQSVIKGSSMRSDSKLSFKVQRDKVVTNQVLESLGIPLAPWSNIENETQLLSFGKKIGFPCVIKAVGFSQGKHVYPNIKNEEELLDKFRLIKNDVKGLPSWKQKIIVQKKVCGSDYRILTVNGKFRIATERAPAFVSGDGVSTIEQLINQTNTDPRRDIKSIRHTLKPIVIDGNLKEVLEKSNKSLNYIPKKGEAVAVRDVASMSQGGVTIDFTDEVHPQIKAICEAIAKSIEGYILGIDIICNDISQPLTPENGSIIEVNSMPEVYLNVYPTEGKSYGEEYPGWVLENMIAATKPCINLVFNADANMVINKFTKGGLVIKNHLYVNGNHFSELTNKPEAVYAMFRNSNLDELTICFDDLEEAKETGLITLEVSQIFAREDLHEDISQTFDITHAEWFKI